MAPRKIIPASLLILVGCSLVSLVLNLCVGNDSGAFYIPMAEAFGEGRYAFAFNAVIPPLVPFLAGLVARTLPVDGFTAMKIVSAAFILLGMIPLYRLSRRLLSAEQARWSCLLYAVCAQVIRFGISAQLTAAKFFFCLWVLEGCVSVYEKRTVRSAISLGLAFAGLSLCRTEGFFYAPLCLVALLLPKVTQNGDRQPTLARRALAFVVLALTCLVVWSPWLAYVYRSTGYLVLDSRQAKLAQILTSQIGIGPDQDPEASSYGSEKANLPGTIYAQGVGEKLFETLDGFYLPYLPLTCLAFVRRFRNGQWGYLENWTLGAVVLQVMLIWIASAADVPVLKRYIFPAALFVMPYSTLGWVTLKDWCVDKARSEKLRSVFAVAVVIVAIVSVGDGMKQVTDSLRGKYDLDRNIGLWLKANALGLDRNRTPDGAPLGRLAGHWSGRSFLIAAAYPQSACWAQAQHIKVDRRQKKTMQALMAYCRDLGVDVLQVDKKVRDSTDVFDANHPSLKRIDSPWSERGVDLYQCVFPETIE